MLGRKILLLVLSISIFVACKQQKQVNVAEYLDYLDKNWADLTDSREFNNITYQARFLPNDYRIIDRFGDDISQEQLDEERKNLTEYQYYQIRLKSVAGDILRFNLNDGENAQSRSDYYNYQFAENVRLLDNGDTLQCEAHQFIPNHGISPWVSVLAAFKSTQGNKTKRIVIDDHIFHNGKVILKISASAISKIPQLTLNKS